MASTFHGLEVGKRSLFAQQSALHTTGHNLSNANTEGFTRQRVNFQTTNPYSYPGMNNDRSPRQLGTGVVATSITRMREDYLDIQFHNENKNLGYWENVRDVYSRVEQIMNEPSEDGMQKLMDRFWQSWQDLAKNPESLAARAVVRERAVAVADEFRHMMQSLDQVETDLNHVLTANVREVNVIATQIADLNDQISRLVPHGYHPNDLLDRRDVLLDRLSKMINVEVRHGANGNVEVLAAGQQLVNGNQAQQMTLDPLTFELGIGGTPIAPTSGSLAGILEGRGRMVNGQMTGILPSMRQQLNQYAVMFAQELNGVHQAGLDSQGNAGVPFFVDRNNPPAAPGNAASLMVNPEILAALDKIAAGKTANAGDGTNAQDMASLKMARFTFSGQTSTFDDFYRNAVAGLGVKSQEARRVTENMETLVAQVENRRQSVSGVSIDEEMSNIIKHQQAYNAAARFVTSIDEMLDKVINGMGRVGL